MRKILQATVAEVQLLVHSTGIQYKPHINSCFMFKNRDCLITPDLDLETIREHLTAVSKDYREVNNNEYLTWASLNRMPKLINDPRPFVPAIVAWRLTIGK